MGGGDVGREKEKKKCTDVFPKYIPSAACGHPQTIKDRKPKPWLPRITKTQHTSQDCITSIKKTMGGQAKPG